MAVPILDHREGQCRAIIGYENDDASKALMCGEACVLNANKKLSSYCAHHFKLHFQPHTPKIRLDHASRTKREPVLV
jgi:hypothetical protein